jgi:hypothetical protein
MELHLAPSPFPLQDTMRGCPQPCPHLLSNKEVTMVPHFSSSLLLENLWYFILEPTILSTAE